MPTDNKKHEEPSRAHQSTETTGTSTATTQSIQQGPAARISYGEHTVHLKGMIAFVHLFPPSITNPSKRADQPANLPIFATSADKEAYVEAMIAAQLTCVAKMTAKNRGLHMLDTIKVWLASRGGEATPEKEPELHAMLDVLEGYYAEKPGGMGGVDGPDEGPPPQVNYALGVLIGMFKESVHNGEM